jgi:hypothetical protein
MTTIDIIFKLGSRQSLGVIIDKILSVAQNLDLSVLLKRDHVFYVGTYSGEFLADTYQVDSIKQIDEFPSPKDVSFKIGVDVEDPYTWADVRVLGSKRDFAYRVIISPDVGVVWAGPDSKCFDAGKKYYALAKHLHRELLASTTRAMVDNSDEPEFQFGGVHEKLLPKFEGEG